MARPRPPTDKLPSRDELIRYLAGAEKRPRTNELLRAFGLGAGDRAALRSLMRDLEARGDIAPKRVRTRERPARGLPAVAVVEVVKVDENGDLSCRSELSPDSRITLPLGPETRRQAPGQGERLLVRLRDQRGGYEAELLKILPRRAPEVVGVLEGEAGDLRLRPADRNARDELRIDKELLHGAVAGDLVRARITSAKALGTPRAEVVERLGRVDEPGAISLAIAAQAELPMVFPEAALAQAAAALPVPLGDRTDLRDLDLVTIDGEDARDFDDAVWAAPDTTPGNRGGFAIVVAIADVAHYVRPGDALDREALLRGNSVYFPDRVIPMLPEALSDDLCSLRPDEDRACLVVRMRIDAKGQLIEHRFERGLMRSRARLTYTAVQAAHEGATDALPEELRLSVIEPLFAAYAVLAAARAERGAIDLDLPERKVLFDADGRVAAIGRRERLAAHALIEEFMILANVAAATVLEERMQPGLYRVHDRPDPAKLAVLADYLGRIGVPWTSGAKQPGEFTALLARLADHELKETVSGFVLRTQAQAFYSPRNIGHFGLNLRRYAHFTSPIRRYADLVVHRALIQVAGLGEDGLGDVDVERLGDIGAAISKAERRAMEAERAVLQRFVALYMSSNVGARFAAKVTGVQRFGLFVTLEENGADGLVPVSTLGEDLFLLDERHHSLTGRRYGESFGLGDRLEVELAEADAVTGSLLFRVMDHHRPQGARLQRPGPKPPARKGSAGRRSARGRR